MKPSSWDTSRRAIVLAVSAALLGALLATTALAHDTWLLPSSLRVPVGRAITLNLTSGMAFPADDFAIVPSRVVRADVRLGGSLRRLAAPRRAPMALRYIWKPARAGIATLAVELAPKTLALTPAQVSEYLDEINAAPALRAAWDSVAAPKQWRESYSKHAMTFVRVGAPSVDSSWATPLGLALEIVPEHDPTALRAGDTLAFRVLRGGRPLSGFAVSARSAGATTAKFVTTDTAGRARVALPTPGLWLLAATDLRRSERPGLAWESDFTTVTLAVLTSLRPPQE